MSGRTFAIGDIHGELDMLRAVLSRLPTLSPEDTVVFLGDYIDRGPKAEEVVRVVRFLDRECGANVVCLRGNHEDAWLRVIDGGFPEFVFPPGNGCFATWRSYTDKAPLSDDDPGPSMADFDAMCKGDFFPAEVVAWMRSLPLWYEDDHAIYVHAGLLENPAGGFFHPRDATTPSAMLWTRTRKFFREYRGKRVVVGHTHTSQLPPELSHYTPEDPDDLWAGECVVAIDTGAGASGFLTAVELPALTVFESR